METKEKSMITVRALRMGYYNHKRYREGDVFEMEESCAYSHDKQGNIRKEKSEDGKEYPVLCSWLEHAEEPKPAPQPIRRQLKSNLIKEK